MRMVFALKLVEVFKFLGEIQSCEDGISLFTIFRYPELHAVGA